WIIILELSNAIVSQWVREELFEDFVWYCRNICSDERSITHMSRAADAGDEYFRLIPVVFVDLLDLADELHAIAARIIHAANKWADDVCTGFCCKKRLSGGEAQRDIRADFAPLEFSHSDDTIWRHGYFDNDMLVPFCIVDTLL